VIVWDEGTYRNLTVRNGQPFGVSDAVRAGHLSVWLAGTKLNGGWSLTRTHGGPKETWIMVKRADERALPGFDVEAVAPDSVRSERSLAEVGADTQAERWTRARATWRPPMLASLVRPADHLQSAGSKQWQYERKLDGLRCLAVRNGDEVELWSRNHLSFTARFPTVVAALAQLPVDNFTLDGELVAFEGSRTSFAGCNAPTPTPRRSTTFSMCFTCSGATRPP